MGNWWEKIKNLIICLLNRLLNLVYKGIDWLFTNMNLTARQSFVVSAIGYLFCMIANACLIYVVAPFDQWKEPWAVIILIGAPVLSMFPFFDRMLAKRFEFDLQDVIDMPCRNFAEISAWMIFY